MKPNAASMLRELPPKAPFRVPEGYFEALPTRIAARIEQEQQTPFRVPEGYFVQLPQVIDDRITRQTLPVQPHESILDMPEGYFDDLAQRVQARIVAPAATQQPTLGYLRRVVYWGATLGLLWGGVWLAGRYFENNKQTSDEVAQVRLSPKTESTDSVLTEKSLETTALSSANPVSSYEMPRASAPRMAQSPTKQMMATKKPIPLQKLTQIDKQELLEYLEGIDLQDDLVDKFIEAQATPEELRQRLEGEEDDLRSELEYLHQLAAPITPNPKNQQNKAEPHKE